MNRRLITVVLVVLALLALAAPVSAAPYCGIRWGSLPKTAERFVSNPVVDADAGRHTCYDRFVVRLSPGSAPGYLVRYVPAVTDPGRGAVIPLRGTAFLQVSAQAPSYYPDGRPSVPWRLGDQIVNVGGFRTFRQVKFAGSFEGYSDFGIGVRARLPFRVLRLSSPPRLVIDVAHYW
jgi:hypothetical protein